MSLAFKELRCDMKTRFDLILLVKKQGLRVKSYFACIFYFNLSVSCPSATLLNCGYHSVCHYAGAAVPLGLDLTLFSAAFLVKYSRLNLTMSAGLFLITSLEKSLRISGRSSGTTICSAEKILISRTSAILCCFNFSDFKLNLL